ncbi:hypothetical protein HKCCE2091_13410 [Rhodobacterales bacterium HKCCE2091]|nr:hypothetical protein [Rhodobacterales bacterium HKCCE2091]
MTDLPGLDAPITAPPTDRPSPPVAAAIPGPETDALRAAARELEAAFLSEMLKQAGFGEARGAFGGGVGEQQFASLLRDQHAHAMADAGGIGLAEQIFRALAARQAQEQTQ